MERYLNKVICGDCLDVMKGMPDGCVQCCVTSPPYWGLRDYGTATWEGGAPGCDHKRPGPKDSDARTPKNGYKDGFRNGVNDTDHAQEPYRDICRKCGARRIDQQYGLEQTPEEYVAKMVEVFREVRRLLKDDGTCWVNLGDSYWNGGGEKRDGGHGFVDGGKRKLKIAEGALLQRKSATELLLKPKDICGIPWRLAFALQADGWVLRQDIIWSKGNCMPESVKDRCTKSHEYIFLLSKSARYFFDHEAIQEKASIDTHARYARGRSDSHKWADGGPGNQSIAKSFDHMVSVPNNYKGSIPGRHDGPGQDRRSKKDRAPGVSFSGAVKDVVENRNKRSVWHVNSVGFPQAHFATFPPKLIEPCILAGSRMGDVVLDPFGGAGTTGMVAAKLGRNYLLLELNPDYCRMAEERIARETAQLNMFTQNTQQRR